MKRAAIIVYGNNSGRIRFWFLGRPCEIGKLNIEIGGESYEIFIFEVPHTKEIKHKIKEKRIIHKFCGENNIQFVFHVDETDEKLNSIWLSIKILCVLREVGIIRGEDVLSQSFGIISDTLNPILMEAISEEASSIIALKTGSNDASMKELHKKIMEEKGLSIAFVNDIEFLLNQSKIILWDGLIPAERYKNALMSACIDMRRVLILPKHSGPLQPDSVMIRFEDEIAKAIIKFAPDTDIWKTASYFPFVCFLDEQGNPVDKERIRRLFLRSNKALTIQKC